MATLDEIINRMQDPNYLEQVRKQLESQEGRAIGIEEVKAKKSRLETLMSKVSVPENMIVTDRPTEKGQTGFGVKTELPTISAEGEVTPDATTTNKLLRLDTILQRGGQLTPEQQKQRTKLFTNLTKQTEHLQSRQEQVLNLQSQLLEGVGKLEQPETNSILQPFANLFQSYFKRATDINRAETMDIPETGEVVNVNKPVGSREQNLIQDAERVIDIINKSKLSEDEKLKRKNAIWQDLDSKLNSGE